MIYEFFADGFEETEAVTPLDMLIRAGADIKTVSIGESKTVNGAHGIKIVADITIDEINSIPEMIILPGGMPGAKNLRNCKKLCDLISDTAQNGGFIAAICASPYILGEMGLLKGKNAICFPGFEDKLYGAVLSDKKVVRDGQFITACGMGVSLQFGIELVSSLFGKEISEKLMASVLA